MIARPDHADPLAGLLAALPTIALPELQEQAAFLTRTDRKYLVPASSLVELLDELGGNARVLEIDGRRCFGYQSPYFDSDDFDAYYAALRRRPHRFKVRTRLYTDSALCHLEVKIHDARGRTVKHRIAHTADRIEQLTASERAWLRDFPQVARYAERLRLCITTTYRRSTLLLPDGAGRSTIDQGLIFSMPSGGQLALPGMAIIETKGGGKATTLDAILWRHGYRPQSLSKFAIGLSLLLPDLPANRWHRTRQRLMASTGQEQDHRVPENVIECGEGVDQNDKIS